MYILPKLGFSYEALEPYIDAKTMEIHHSKHHQSYINNFNSFIEKNPELSNKPVEKLLAELPSINLEDKEKTFLKNNAGGTVNHTFFWKLMGLKKEIDEVLNKRIIKAFGSVVEFKKLFTQTAVSHFGSGWAWLAEDKNKKLFVYSLPNQDTPYSKGHTPIITVDLWEHAYYLKYQNRRAEYIDAWWNVLKII